VSGGRERTQGLLCRRPPFGPDFHQQRALARCNVGMAGKRHIENKAGHRRGMGDPARAAFTFGAANFWAANAIHRVGQKKKNTHGVP
jgi:hypothetical protein